MIQTAEGYNFPAGIGYIALPVDLTREAYISLCYKTCTVCLRTDDGGFFNRCPISESDLNSIDFPEDINKLGSAVVFVNEPIKNQLLVVALYPSIDEVQDGREGQFKIKRKVSDSYVEISGSGKDRFIGISVVSLTDNPSEFYVRVSNKKQNSKLKLEVTGDIEVLSTKNTKLVAFDSTTIETKNSSDKNKLSQFKQTSQENYFESDNFTIKCGETEVNVSKDGIEIVTSKTIDMVASNSSLSLDDSGIHIDAGDGNLFLSGNRPVLYSKVSDTSEILDLSQIGISETVKVG